MSRAYANYQHDGNPNAIILPYLGEFGWLILNHVRFADWYPSPNKIICCQPGEECLYPSAAGFFTDYSNPVPENVRCGPGGFRQPGSATALDAELTKRFQEEFPGYSVVRPSYDCKWHTSDLVKAKLRVRPVLPAVDVALGVRRREFVTGKNWQHWESIARSMQSVGLTVGLVGSRETSFDFGADAVAWDHPDGHTAGTVDLLSRCRLYIGTCTGVSHLAAMLDTPSLIFRKEEPGNPDLTGIMERANKRFHRRLPESVWDNPDQVLGAAVRCLAEIKRPS